ncbi:hypothetical protein CCR75_006396 [Bremia lactucae]|uniref:Uncharacterized protein n=1 Tax=Bremia lactucae TaxID=4779 RepID=A0A976IJI0_BRELC|nr:hypothetical protein CCR75_006396 [Bremia lactucae]
MAFSLAKYDKEQIERMHQKSARGTVESQEALREGTTLEWHTYGDERRRHRVQATAVFCQATSGGARTTPSSQHSASSDRRRTGAAALSEYGGSAVVAVFQSNC